MNIIIIGCGKVGYKVAEHLVEEGHDITMVDQDADRLQAALNDLDIQGFVGSGTSIRTQQEAGIQNADLFIAVTGQDEINLLSCLIAKKVNNCRTIARVRNPEYFEERAYLRQCLDISLIINPDASTAKTISQLIQVPSATEIDTFAKGKVDMLQLEIPKDSPLDGMNMIEFAQKFNRVALVCALVHEKQVIIPNGRTVMHTGDMIYTVVPPKEIRKFCRGVGLPVRPLKDVMIIGGSKIGYYLTKRLTPNGISVKIVDKDREHCEWLSECLDANVICADATEHHLLKEENLEQMDAFVALTNMDEENMFLSLYANKIAPGCKKITKNNRVSLNDLAMELPVGSIVSPMTITAEYITQYVRSMNNSMSDSYCSEIESVYQLVDNQVEALEFTIKEDSRITGKPLQELKMKKGLLVCCIVRGDQVITPGGRDMMMKGDTVIVVTTIKRMDDILDILEK